MVCSITVSDESYDRPHSGLAGRGEWEQAKVDEILDFQKDLHKECLSYIFTSLGFQKGDLVGKTEAFGVRPVYG